MSLPLSPAAVEPWSLPGVTLADLSRARDLVIWPKLSEQLHAVQWITGALALILALIAVLWFIQSLRVRRQISRPVRTFLRLARGLRVSWRECWLLWAIARQQKLPTPLALLLSPATLHHHAQAYAQHLAPARHQRVVSRVDRLSQRLFGGDR